MAATQSRQVLLFGGTFGGANVVRELLRQGDGDRSHAFCQAGYGEAVRVGSPP